MRQEDRAEVLAWSGLDPWAALQESVRRSPDCKTATADGRIACMFGVAEAAPGVGLPWFLGTNLVDRHGSHMWRTAPRHLLGYLDRFPVLMNAVHADNLLALRWLERLGAKIYPACPQGAAGALFHTFEIRRDARDTGHLPGQPGQDSCLRATRRRG
jgi:hypothetical protein